jgi:hypothetical protein
MARVTRRFKENFDVWARWKIERGDFTEAEMEEFREAVRRDLAPGPDTNRNGLTVIVGGVEVSAAIDDPEERARLWDEFFADEAECIRGRLLRAA